QVGCVGGDRLDDRVCRQLLVEPEASHTAAEPGEMPVAKIRKLARLDGSLEGVLSHRLEQRVPIAGVLDQALVDQVREQVEDLQRLEIVARSDRLRRVEVERRREYPEPAEEHPFGLVEELVAPVDRR